MKTHFALVAAIATATALGSVAPAALADGACCPRDPSCAAKGPAIRDDSVRPLVNQMLKQEGYHTTDAADIGIRRVDLDGDANTEEALVDIVAPDLCRVGGCPTLVVVARGGKLRAVGHGAFVGLLPSRTHGWLNLVDNSPSAVPLLPLPRPLHWSGSRYAL